MAITFGAAADRVDHGSGTSLDNLPVFTYIYLVNPTTVTGWLMSKGDGVTDFKRVITVAGGAVRLVVVRATTNTTYNSAASVLVTGQWQFISLDFDDARGAAERVNIYKGTLNSPMAETAYGAITEGVDGITDDSGGNVYLGNDSFFSGSNFQGAMSFAAIFNRILTPNERETIRKMFLPGSRIPADPSIIPGCRLWTLPGLQSVSAPQIDYSGRGNHGTVTGATRVEDPYRLARDPINRTVRRGYLFDPLFGPPISAFQPSAFQNDAFQIGWIPTGAPPASTIIPVLLRQYRQRWA